MADDRLDDAIDAVVRAVDRIERATRRPGVEMQHPDARPPVTAVSPGRDAWSPESGKKKGKGKKARLRDEAAAVDAPVEPIASPVLPSDAAPEVHELVGRIVARTQELDDQLAAMQQLRAELNALVARLAAAATHPR